MEEYISKNGLTMVKGNNFNWQKTPVYFDQLVPFVLSISMGTLDEMYVGSYDLDTKILLISLISFDRPFTMKFYARSLIFAEDILLGFIKGNNYEIMPLYKQEN